MIQSLHAAPQHASRVTEWLWQAFGGETLPQAFFASIVEHLYPWMAALYVAPEARGQGLAGKLQQHVIEYARAQGYGELFLYSACRDFYERFGWQYIGEGLDYPASAVSLYRYDLSLSRGAITE